MSEDRPQKPNLPNVDDDFLESVKGNFELRKLLGRGSYGYVYEGIAVEGNCFKMEKGARVAIKVVRNAAKNFPTINAKRVLREIVILRNFNHPNIIKFRGLLAPKDINNLHDLYMVFDYMVTDLHKILQSNQPISDKHVQYITYQMLKGLQIMHHNEIIHRDIKPANILIDERVHVKICDFGLARSVSVNPRIDLDLAKHQELQRKRGNSLNSPSDVEGSSTTTSSSSSSSSSSMPRGRSPARNGVTVQGVEPFVRRPDEKVVHETKDSDGNVILEHPTLHRAMTHHVVTRWYRAPELILQSPDYTMAIDIWSVGCILAELIAMQLANVGRNPLFPGDSCYPLSPVQPNSKRTRHLDQLAAIFNVIGTPSREELERCFPDDPSVVKYVLTNFPSTPRINLAEKYRNAEPKALDLLDKMLKFDPKDRLDVDQALRHPYLKGIVDELKDDLRLPSTPPPYFDFEDEPLTSQIAQALLVEQVLIDHKHLCPKYVVTKDFAEIMMRREKVLQKKLAHWSDELGHARPVDYFSNFHVYFPPSTFTQVAHDDASDGGMGDTDDEINEDEEDDVVVEMGDSPSAIPSHNHRGPISSTNSGNMANGAFPMPNAPSELAQAGQFSQYNRAGSIHSTVPSSSSSTQNGGSGSFAAPSSTAGSVAAPPSSSSTTGSTTSLAPQTLQRTASRSMHDVASDNKWGTVREAFPQATAGSTRRTLRSISSATRMIDDPSSQGGLPTAASSNNLFPLPNAAGSSSGYATRSLSSGGGFAMPPPQGNGVQPSQGGLLRGTTVPGDVLESSVASEDASMSSSSSLLPSRQLQQQQQQQQQQYQFGDMDAYANRPRLAKDDFENSIKHQMLERDRLQRQQSRRQD